jgi:hypothetical protein
VIGARTDFENAGLMVVPGGGIVLRGVIEIDDLEDLGGQAVSVRIGKEWTGDREGLKLLARLSNLSRLTLEGPQVTDEWLAQLAALGRWKLTHLYLKRTKVTSAGLAHFAGFTSLVQLDVFHSPGVTDAAVPHLSKMANLRLLLLYGTKVSAEGAAALEKALSNTRVDRRSGALLGVRCQPGDDEECRVTGVQPDSAAERAGIREEDKIVGFGGKSIRTFTDLTAAISDKSGGDKVVVVLEREGERITTTVVLGEWQ